MTGEGGGQFVGHAVAKTLRRGGVDLLVEPGHQPAADAPRRAEIAFEDPRARVQHAVDVDLLVDRRAVTTVALPLGAERLLHGCHDGARHRSATDRVKRQGRARLRYRLDQLAPEGRGGAVENILGALLPPSFGISCLRAGSGW